jgi:hypothetical protein
VRRVYYQDVDDQVWSCSPLCRLFFCSFLGVLCFTSKAVRDKWVISSTDSELGRFASPASNRKLTATGSTWVAMAMSLAGFLFRRALLIIPKKEKDYVDPSSLPAPCNSHATTHTSWCRSGVSGYGLLALVHHSTISETSQDTEVFFSGRCIVSLGLCRGVSVRSPVVQASESGLASITAG